MAMLTLKNVNVLAPAEVRIYRVTADGTMSVDPVEFTQLDNGNGSGAGIKLLAAYEVSCVGAIPYAGNFELTLGAMTITNGKTSSTATDFDTMKAGLATFGIKVVSVPLYEPS